MKTTKLEISFDGSRYFGWQIQKDTDLTIQFEVNKALSKLYKTQIQSMGSGRTDARVHALKFFVVFKAPFSIEMKALVQGMNSILPLDIRALTCEEVADGFHATKSALSREYRYLFSNQKIVTPFQRKYLANISYQLDIDLMHKACAAFVGTFDFASYQTTGSDVKTSVRSIYECSLHEKKTDFHGLYPDHFYIHVKGSGFLKQMVRMMVGAIWSVGRGKLTVEDIENSLSSRVGEHISPVASAEGLYKFDIQYNFDK